MDGAVQEAGGGGSETCIGFNGMIGGRLSDKAKSRCGLSSDRVSGCVEAGAWLL